MTAPAPGVHAGVVKRIDGDTAYVHFQRSSMCAHCGACLTLSSGEMETAVKNTLSAVPGDRVAVTIAPERIVSASVIAYGIPLILLILGLYLGSLVSDLWSVILGLALCGSSFLILRRLESGFTQKQTYAPKMTAILTEDENDG